MGSLAPEIPQACPEALVPSVERNLAFFSTALDQTQDLSALSDRLVEMAGRGERFEELLALVLVLRQRMIPFEHQRTVAVDNCGTGGDGLGLFNISTAAAIVASSAGACVIKHGNRSVTGRCGSADLLEAAGVIIDLAPESAREVLARAGIVFLYAPHFHPSLKAVGPLRRSLPMPTIFNLVGPLCNPAGIQRHFLGVASPSQLPVMAKVMQVLGYSHGYVVHGAGGADELTLAGANQVQAVGAAPVCDFSTRAAGLASHPVQDLRGGSLELNVQLLGRVLDAEPGPVLDAVIFNAAGALLTAGVSQALPQACAQARQALVSGAAKEKLGQWVQACKEVAK